MKEQKGIILKSTEADDRLVRAIFGKEPEEMPPMDDRERMLVDLETDLDVQYLSRKYHGRCEDAPCCGCCE